MNSTAKKMRVLQSMTGYGQAQRSMPQGALTLELRGVNGRFLDLQLRMPEDFRIHESWIRETLTEQIARGKVECRINYDRQASIGGRSLQADSGALEQLQTLQTQILAAMPQAQPLNVNDILHWPGVLADSSLSPEALKNLVQELLLEALPAFKETRQREGEKLKGLLLDRVMQMEKLVAELEPVLPTILTNHQQKLTERLQEALGIAVNQGTPAITAEEAAERIRQEVTLYGIRIDVTEELERLGAHLLETRTILQQGGSVGKRLDFMMQELNREANTLGSKAAVKEIADTAMALKLLIEQMREQVQNLE